MSIGSTASSTAVTGNVTVVQPTGTNLHVVTDTTSTTAVTQATGTNLHAVIDSGTITTVSAVTAITNALPSGSNVIGHVINDASSAVIGHVIVDTTSTTAVTQATAANLNAAVVGTGTAGTAAGGVLTVQGVASMTKLLVTPDSVALPANQSVNVAQVAGTNTVTGGVAGIIAVGGNVANAVTATANPVPVGGVFVTSPATLTTGQTATLQFTAAQNAKHDLTTLAGTATDTNSGSKSAGTLRVVIATDQPQLTNKLLVTPDSVALPANQSVNVAQLAGTTTDTNSGSKSAGTLRVVLATDQPALTNKLLVTPDANSAINLAQVNGTTTVNGGSAAGILAVGGPNATNVAITGNPVNNGAQAVSSENAAVTTARQVQLVADLVGKLIVLPYANPENFVSGAITSAMTGTTTTSLLSAPASGLRNYITQITVSNASITVPTDILIQDGSGGTTLYVLPCPIGSGTGTGTSGGTFVFPTPLRQPTTATAIFVANVTTGSSTKVSASGYKGA
jgi:hypothetical protein